VARDRLDSWKAIAEHLKRSPRTVQRWHADFGLPVHHFGGGKGPVFSYTDELDVWLSGFSEDAVREPAAPGNLQAARKKESERLTAQAEELWDLRSESNLTAIAALYRSAVDHDPTNAAAFIGIANSLGLAALMGIVRGRAAYPRASEALQRASRLGHDRMRMLCAAAWLNMTHERKWKPASEAFQQVIDREPRSAHALAGLGMLQIASGNPASAAQSLSEAWRLNTFASVSNAFLCWSQYLAGDSEQALATASQARSTGESGSVLIAVEALSILQSSPLGSDLNRIEEIAAQHRDNPALQGVLGYAYGISDQPGRAREILQRLDRLAGDSNYPIALVFLGLHEWQQALLYLEASYAEGSLWSLGFRSDPILRPLRGDPRLAARLHKLGPST
jgi:Flp pilus assembly protein TadD